MNGLTNWVIYDHPRDYRQGFIARKFVGIEPTQETIKGELGEIRRVLAEAGFVKIPRDINDPTVVLESWI